MLLYYLYVIFTFLYTTFQAFAYSIVNNAFILTPKIIPFATILQWLVRTTRSSTHSHTFQVSLPNPRTLSDKSSFVPRTWNLWNVLPSSCFPESFNLPSFKSKINKLDLISLCSLSLSLSSFFLCWGFV